MSKVDPAMGTALGRRLEELAALLTEVGWQRPAQSLNNEGSGRVLHVPHCLMCGRIVPSTRETFYFHSDKCASEFAEMAARAIILRDDRLLARDVVLRRKRERA